VLTVCAMVNSTRKGLVETVVDALETVEGPLSLEAVARRCGVPHCTTLYVLLHLMGRGEVERNERGYLLSKLGQQHLRARGALEQQLDELLRFVADLERDWGLEVRLSLLR
jgi:hypothetical protein